MNQYPHLFQPLRVKNVIFRNRIFSSPHMLCYANWDGSPSLQMIKFFEEKAKGGCAMVTMGDTPVDEVNGVGIPRHIKLIDQNVNLLAELAYAIKKNGAVASFELNHPGNTARNPDGRPAWGPDGFVRPDGCTVLEMDEDMIAHTVECYAKAAAVLKRAGWDMCILHGAHGWLLGQFLSPAYNHRTDRFGGSLENRARFPIMVIEAVRKAVGPDFLIDYRVSGEEMQENGLTVDECVAFVKMIEDKIDMVHVSAGLDRMPQAIITHPNTYLPNGCNVKYAEAVKKSGVKIPVTAIGGINTPEMAEEILASGKADAVAMCRALIADPYWPKKVRAGRLNEIHQCLRCTNCLAEMHPTDQFHCDVNPFSGHEVLFQDLKSKAARAKTVWIAGGGPGGMTAAITAAERGHTVTLWEKSGQLGGNLIPAGAHDFKAELNELNAWYQTQLDTLGVAVQRNHPATAQAIQEAHPDAVVLAVGATPTVPPVAGMDSPKVVDCVTALTGADLPGQRILVVGGGLVGCETALGYAQAGKTVTIVEALPDILSAGIPVPEMNASMLRDLLAEWKVTLRTGCRLAQVTAEGAVVTGPQGEATLPADHVVLAVGFTPRPSLAGELAGTGMEVYQVGDGSKVGSVMTAIASAYTVARAL